MENFGGSGKPVTRVRWIQQSKFLLDDALVQNSKFSAKEQVDAYLDCDPIVCLECGKSMQVLAMHLCRKHNMSAKEYKEKYNIPIGRALATPAYLDKSSKSKKTMWSEGVYDHTRENIKRRIRTINPLGRSKNAELKGRFEQKCRHYVCRLCGTPFTRPDDVYEGHPRLFCSNACAHKARKK